MFFIVFIAFLCAGDKSIRAGELAETPSSLTVREFLEVHFSNVMARGESDALNSFNLVSFYTSDDPQTAFVFIIQTWRDLQIVERDI